MEDFQNGSWSKVLYNLYFQWFPKSCICWKFLLSISKTSESPLLSISVFPITHPLLCSILHVAKKNVQLYMPNLNGLAKSTGNVDRKYSPIYLGIWLFLQNEKRVSLKCTSLRRKTLWINIQMLFFYAKNNNYMVIKMESG